MTHTASWPQRAENFLDEKGKGAWIATMVLGFIFFWPVGIALLAYMIVTHKFSSKGCKREKFHARRHGFKSSGNTAFDSYKADTLNRLQEEQDNFEDFLDRLRKAKDKAEFDQFMDDRASDVTDEQDETDDVDGTDTDVTDDQDGTISAKKPR